MVKRKPATVTPINEARYIPMRRYTRVEYVESDGPEDAPPFWAKIRTNLTFGEVEVLTWDKDTPTTEVWEAIAPHVVEWNAATLNDAGEVVDLDPPAVAGGGQFAHIPNILFWKLLVDLKSGATGTVEKKSSTPPVSTAEPPNASASSGDESETGE